MHGFSFGTAIDRIARIVSNPGSNLTGAVLLLAMVVLVLLILSVAALITILPSRDDDEDEDEDEDAEGGPAQPTDEGASAEDASDRAAEGETDAEPPRRRRGAAWTIAVPVVLFAAAFAWGWVVTGSPSTCSSCHVTAAWVDNWKTGDHRAVACVTCHEDGGVGLPAAALYRVVEGISTVQGKALAPSATRPVPAYRCLRCHADIESGVKVSHDVRVSHAAFLALGYACQRCHAGVGHSAAAGAARAVDMNQCVGCHDGKTASAECRTCHPGDPSTAVRFDRAVFPEATITPPPGCTGCHQTKTCLACHGIVMPHPAGFGTGKGHAALAAFTKKDTLCYRCHVPQDCRQCHKGDFSNHGPDWIKIHGNGVPLDGRDACACHVTPNFCGLCHKTTKA
jgi:hypothetical protein